MWTYLGCLYLQRVPKTIWEGGDIDKAVNAFNKALKFDGNHNLAAFHLMAIYAGKGDNEKVKEYLNKLKSAHFDFNTLIKKKNGPAKLQISGD